MTLFANVLMVLHYQTFLYYTGLVDNFKGDNHAANRTARQQL